MMKLLLILCFGLSTQVFSQKIDSLSIKIGQMIMVGVQGTDVNENLALRKNIKQGKLGGIILFEKNINPKNSHEKLKGLISGLSKETQTPLFVAIDQEGGQVNRLKQKYGFVHYPSATYLGKTQNLDSTRYYAFRMGKLLKELGFNVNFAPVVDLNIADNPIINKYDRAYSSNPDSVAMHASVVIDEMNKNNVISVLKHFPGHGSSKEDSHLGMVDVTKYWTEEELIPYQKLIDLQKVDAIMSAHIINKKLDDQGLPATVSDKIINGILRNNLSYDGVIFSDDMQMHAITKYYGLKTAIKKSLLAGIDVLIFSNNIANTNNTTVEKVHSLIRQMVQNNEITIENINKSHSRIIKLKSSLNVE